MGAQLSNFVSNQASDDFLDLAHEEQLTRVQRELLLHGFIKHCLPTETTDTLPTDVIGLIDLYYPTMLTWNRSKHGENVEFPSWDIAEHAHPRDYSAPGGLVVASTVIDSKQRDRYSWQIRLAGCGYPVCLGFIVLPISKSMQWDVSSFGSAGNNNQIGISCYEGQGGIYPTESIEPRPTHVYYREPRCSQEVRRGGVFRFDVDFKQKTCYLYYGHEQIMNAHGRGKLNLYPKDNGLQQDIRIVPAAVVCRGGKYIIQEVVDSQE